MSKTKSRMQDMEAKLKVYKDQKARNLCNNSEKIRKQAFPLTPKTNSPSNPPAAGGAAGKDPSAKASMPKTDSRSNPPVAGGAGKDPSVKRTQTLSVTTARTIFPNSATQKMMAAITNNMAKTSRHSLSHHNTPLHWGFCSSWSAQEEDGLF